MRHVTLDKATEHTRADAAMRHVTLDKATPAFVSLRRSPSCVCLEAYFPMKFAVVSHGLAAVEVAQGVVVVAHGVVVVGHGVVVQVQVGAAPSLFVQVQS